MRKTIIVVVKGKEDAKEVRVTINKSMLIGTVGKAEFKWNIEKYELPTVTIKGMAASKITDVVRESIASFIKTALKKKGLSFDSILGDAETIVGVDDNDIPTPDNDDAVPPIESNKVIKNYYVAQKDDEVKIFSDKDLLLNFIIGGDSVKVNCFIDKDKAIAFAKKVSGQTDPDPYKSPTPKPEFDVKALKEELKKELLEELRAELKDSAPSIAKDNTQESDDITAPEFEDDKEDEFKSAEEARKQIDDIMKGIDGDGIGF